MSRIAAVRCGRTLGSDNIDRQDMGPCCRYVFKKVETASLPRPPLVISSILETVSGLRIPCAVGKEGSVSDSARTLFERRQLLPRSCSAPTVLSIFWAIMGAVVCEVGDEGGRYVVHRDPRDEGAARELLDGFTGVYEETQANSRAASTSRSLREVDMVML